MFDTADWVLLGVGLTAFAYPLVMRGLAAWVHPYRAEMAHLSDELVTSPYLGDEEKDAVEAIMDDAFNWRTLWLVAVLLPMSMPSFMRKSGRSYPKIRDEETRHRFDRFLTLMVRSQSAANPLAAIIVAAEIAALTMVLAPLGKLGWQKSLLLKAAKRSEKILEHRAAC